MKKVLLVITMLFTFFLSPVKADSGAPYFYALSFVDLTALGMGDEVGVTAYWRFDVNKSLLPIGAGRIINVPQVVLDGNVTIELGGGTSIDATFKWYSDYAIVNYLGVEINVDFWYPYENGQQVEDFVTGNGFEWWSDSSEETPSSDIDLSTIQNYMLVICVLLFMNFLRGR